MKTLIKFIKRFTFAITEFVITLLGIILGAIAIGNSIPTYALLGLIVVFSLISIIRLIGSMRMKASIEFLQAIDKGAKLQKVSVKADKVAVKAATKSVKADAKAQVVKAQAKSFLE